MGQAVASYFCYVTLVCMEKSLRTWLRRLSGVYVRRICQRYTMAQFWECTFNETPPTRTGIYYQVNIMNYSRSWNTLAALGLWTCKCSLRDTEYGFILVETSFLQFLYVQSVFFSTWETKSFWEYIHWIYQFSYNFRLFFLSFNLNSGQASTRL